MQIFFMLPLILIYVLFRSVVGTCVAIFTSQDCRGFPGCLRTVWQRTTLWSHIIYIYMLLQGLPRLLSHLVTIVLVCGAV